MYGSVYVSGSVYVCAHGCAYSHWSYFMAKLYREKNNSISARAVLVTLVRTRARTRLLSADSETTIAKKYRLSLSALDTRDNHVKNKKRRTVPSPSSSSKEIDPSCCLFFAASYLTTNARQIIYARRLPSIVFYAFLLGDVATRVTYALLRRNLKLARDDAAQSKCEFLARGNSSEYSVFLLLEKF